MNSRRKNILILTEGENGAWRLQRGNDQISENSREKANLSVFDVMRIDKDKTSFGDCKKALEEADFVLIWLHGSIAYFKSYREIQPLLKEKMFCVCSGIESENSGKESHAKLTEEEDKKIRSYIEAGGLENEINLLKFMVFCAGAGNEIPPEPHFLPQDGVYYISKERSETKGTLSKPGEKYVIGILTHYHSVASGDTEHIEETIRAIERAGGGAFALYSGISPAPDKGSPGLKHTLRRYWYPEGKAVVDAVLVISGFSLTVLSQCRREQEDILSVFQELDVPVIQAPTMSISEEEWEKSAQGMDAMSLYANVYQPEFDGQLIGWPIACRQPEETEGGIQWKNRPIPRQVEETVRLAMNWARLRGKPAAEKRIAILLHNTPPRRDMIGCAYGLDTAKSLEQILHQLKNAGIYLEWNDEEIKDCFHRLVRGLTNDNQFLSPEEQRRYAADLVGKPAYEEWLRQIPHSMSEHMRKDWGSLPGEILSTSSELLIPGLLGGNVFVGLQPPRGREDQAEMLCHSLEIACPHQYFGYYRWISRVFQADAILHLGTHGTLEWLPGKSCGLSARCFPQQLLDGIPNIYPYAVDVVGEGMQAKRRSGACLIGHMSPAVKQAGLYGSLSELQELCDNYRKSWEGDENKIESRKQAIWEKIAAENLEEEMKISREFFFQDTEAALRRVHDRLMGLKETYIKDGFHIFGQIPDPDRQDLLVETMMEADWDAAALSEKSAADNQIENALNERRLYEREADIPKEARENLRESLKGIEKELEGLEAAIAGRFVPPGPGGCLSRRGSELLPTGRNFYSLDPLTIPDRSAWETGKRLASQLLEQYRADEGKFPETLAIVVYSGDVIRTGGDDIAEILYLYGIRPIWRESDRAVLGLEVIPLHELGRPRIDVILRVSGLFRDTFPNLIEKIEDAVNLVAALQEESEVNYIRKHILADIEAWKEKGCSEREARRRSEARIFGCPPKSYGAGVDSLIHSGNWQSGADLAEMYLSWSGYTYGKAFGGEQAKESLRGQLARVEATIKNISTHETDLLDDDDFYIYHGGLIRAAQEIQGKKVRSYSALSDGARVTIDSVERELAKVMRARVVNPAWLDGLKRHGFRGAQEVSAVADMLFGWDATAQAAADWMYDEMVDCFVKTQENRRWLEEENPWALHALCGRLLEARQRGMWVANQERAELLQEWYLRMEGVLEEGHK